MRSVLILSAAVFLFSIPSMADSTTLVDLTASACQSCFPGTTEPAETVDAQLDLIPVTGTFFDSGGGYLFTGSVYEVIGITGTLNGSPMTLAAAPQGDGSWLYMCSSDSFCPGSVYFTANGSFSWFEFDGANSLLEISDSNGDG
jgi:hypothetical protein